MRLHDRSRSLTFLLAVSISVALMISVQAGTAYTELRVQGMTCAACASRVSETVSKVLGVLEVDVSLAEGRASIQLDGDAIPSQAAWIKAIEDAGFEASSAVGRDYQEELAFSDSSGEALGQAEASMSPIHVHTLSKDGAELRERFNADSDKLRLILLLSPS